MYCSKYVVGKWFSSIVKAWHCMTLSDEVIRRWSVSRCGHPSVPLRGQKDVFLAYTEVAIYTTVVYIARGVMYTTVVHIAFPLIYTTVVHIDREIVYTTVVHIAFPLIYTTVVYIAWVIMYTTTTVVYRHRVCILNSHLYISERFSHRLALCQGPRSCRARKIRLSGVS